MLADQVQGLCGLVDGEHSPELASARASAPAVRALKLLREHALKGRGKSVR